MVYTAESLSFKLKVRKYRMAILPLLVTCLEYHQLYFFTRVMEINDQHINICWYCPTIRKAIQSIRPIDGASPYSQ